MSPLRIKTNGMEWEITCHTWNNDCSEGNFLSRRVSSDEDETCNVLNRGRFHETSHTSYSSMLLRPRKVETLSKSLRYECGRRSTVKQCSSSN
jgi:hypothetical protein